MTKFEKIVLIAIGALVGVSLVFGAIIFRQQKAITSLTEKKEAPFSQNSAKKNNLSAADSIKKFFGTIESISGNQLVVNFKLTDFSKSKNPEKLKNSSGLMNVTGEDFEVIDKKISVNTNEKTVFGKKSLDELKVRDTVSVFSDKSPYTSDSVTAEMIIYIVSPK